MLKVKVNLASNFNPKRLEKLKEAISLTERVVNSDEFKKMILSHNYWYSTGRLWWKKWYNPKAFRWNLGYTNQGVYDKIMSGAEVLSPEKDAEIDVDIECVVARHNGVLGFTYPNTLRTYVYSWFFDSADLPDLVGNIVHEWCHKIGFGHEYRNTALRQYTVPYAVGYIAEGVARRML